MLDVKIGCKSNYLHWGVLILHKTNSKSSGFPKAEPANSYADFSAVISPCTILISRDTGFFRLVLALFSKNGL